MAARTKPKPEPAEEDEPPIEGTAVVVRESTGGDPGPERALQAYTPVQGHLAVGVGALASMSDEAFAHNLTALTKGVERAAQVKRAIMVENEDFGLIPGTQKPTLLKPGAEKLALAYGLVGRFTHHIRYGDGEIDPPINVVVDSFIHLGDTSGPVVAQGMGMASSWEKRYRYRGAAGRHCPKCGKDNVIRSKTGGWWCGTRDGGCGTSYNEGDQTIEGQEDPGKAEIEDPYELGNTLLKMAEKRAYVDGVLRATASSGLFTQDMEDRGGPPPPPPASAPAPARAAPPVQRTATGATPAAAAAPGPSTAATAPAPARAGSTTVQGIVETNVEGIRRVKPTSEQFRRYFGDYDGPIDKLEVVLKSGGRKHTALIFEARAAAVDAMGLVAGDTVAIDGVVEEIVWQEGKPTKKEIWAVSRVQVLRNGAWLSENDVMPGLGLPTEEVAAPAAVDPSPASPAAAVTPSSSPTAPVESSASDDDDEPPVPARRVAAELPTERPDDGLTGPIVGRVTEYKFTDRYGSFKIAHASGEILRCVVGDDPPGELAEVLGRPDDLVYPVGMEVIVTGLWKNGWIVVSAIGVRPL